MTHLSPWPIPAFKDREKNECPRCKRVVPRDAVGLRPAARDGLALGRDVALELESRISDALGRVTQKLDTFGSDPFDFFTELDSLRASLVVLGTSYLTSLQNLQELEDSHAEWDEKIGASEWSHEHKGEVDDVIVALRGIADSGRELFANYMTAATAMRRAAEGDWADVDSRLRSLLKLVNRSRDFYDHLLSAQTAGDLAHATQQRALNETWNELATELADVSG
jgi:hypothetical protein